MRQEALSTHTLIHPSPSFGLMPNIEVEVESSETNQHQDGENNQTEDD